MQYCRLIIKIYRILYIHSLKINQLTLLFRLFDDTAVSSLFWLLISAELDEFDYGFSDEVLETASEPSDEFWLLIEPDSADALLLSIMRDSFSSDFCSFLGASSMESRPECPRRLLLMFSVSRSLFARISISTRMGSVDV